MSKSKINGISGGRKTKQNKTKINVKTNTLLDGFWMVRRKKKNNVALIKRDLIPS